MIEVRLNNIITIGLCGVLGYALVIGLSKLFNKSGGASIMGAQ